MTLRNLLLHLLKDSFSKTTLRERSGIERGFWAGSDDCKRIDGQPTSTSHQPANACLALGLQPEVDKSCQLQCWKIGKIKGLPRK